LWWAALSAVGHHAGELLMAENTTGSLMVQRRTDVHIIEFMEVRILDQLAIDKIKTDILNMVAEAGVPKFIISFENVKYISSAVLGMLMTVNKHVMGKQGELRLASIDKSLMEVFKLTRLDKILKIFGSTDDALKKFEGA
jgi:anti-sigma B factor antagonist